MVGLPPLLVPAVLVFVAVAMGVVALSLGVEWAADRRRQSEVAKRLAELDQTAAGGGTLLRAETDDVPWLRALAERVPQIRDLEHVLRQGAVPWTVSTYLILTVGLAVALGLGGAIAFGFGIAPVVLAAIGAAGPYVYVRRKRGARMDRFEEQLPEAVELIGRAIRAGHPLTAGLRMVSDEMQEPIAGEFRQVSEEQRFGMPFEDSVTALADRVPLVDVRILVTAVLIQREVGGNLAEILDKISYVVRQRFTIRRQLRVITAEGRMSMWVLMGLPPGMALILLMMNPAYMMTLFRDPIGHAMIWASVVMSIAGFIWIRKIVNIEI